MSVSDAALPMSPRAHGGARGVGIAIALVALAALSGVLFFVNHSSNGAPTSSSSNSTNAANRSTKQASGGAAPVHHLVYGMSHQQVQRLAGRPKKIVGGCWFYTPVKGKIGSVPIGDPGSIAARTTNAVKLCFFAGTLSQEFIHRPVTGSGWKWLDVSL